LSPKVRGFSALAVALGFVATATSSSADLGRDTDGLVLAWSAFGKITRLKPRLLDRGELFPLVLPAEPLDPKTPGCVSVAVIGTTQTHFLLDASAAGQGTPGVHWPEGSLAGALTVTRCGEQKPLLAALALEMRSPRGVLEFLTLASDEPPPALTQVLPHRDPGPMAPLGGSGPRPSVAPLALRLRAAEERATRDRALELSVQDLTASPAGVGFTLLTLAPGCHRFDLLGDEAGRHPTDVDFDIATADGGELLATDHGESSDAGALLCLGRPMPVTLRFSGVGPLARLALVRARWELEPSLPQRWPPEARARFSAVLRDRRVPLTGARLADEALGVQGDTLMPIEVESGACYVAAAVELRGNAAAISLAARSERGTSQSRLDADVPGALLTFCAGPSERALIEIDARGLGLVWMSAVWQLGREKLGEDGR
jgi:hypothetical protein